MRKRGKTFTLAGANKYAELEKELSKLPTSNQKDILQDAHRLALCCSEDAKNLLGYEISKRFNVLPIGLVRQRNQECVTISCGCEINPELANFLKFVTGREVRLVEMSTEVVSHALKIAYEGEDYGLKQQINAINSLQDYKISQNRVQQSIVPVGASSEAKEVVHFLQKLVQYSVLKQASDLHLVPSDRGLIIKIRVNGKLLEHIAEEFPGKAHQEIISRLKVMASLDVTKKGLPQDGSFSTVVEGRSVAVRASFMPTVSGERAVLRFAGLQRNLLVLNQLGLDERTQEFLELCLSKQEGAIFFVGPTGSGKTTAMYATMQHPLLAGSNLVSVEDPVEMVLPNVSQTQISEVNGLSFEKSLRTVLRQDPDVMLIGEIRDAGSANVALQSAISGHLILTSLHAKGLVEVVLRLKSFGLDDIAISQALSLVLRLSLIPILCKSCKVVDLNKSNELGYAVYRSVGCSECDYSGYGEQAMISETIYIDRALRELIGKGALTETALEKELSSENYVSRQSSLERLLKEGKICSEGYTTAST